MDTIQVFNFTRNTLNRSFFINLNVEALEEAVVVAGGGGIRAPGRNFPASPRVCRVPDPRRSVVFEDEGRVFIAVFA